MTPSAASAAGYTVVTDRASMQAVDTNTVSMLCGQFGTAAIPYEYDGVGLLPHLSEMAATALDILDNDPDGFFLMIEGARIDHASHSNDLVRTIFETIEFSDTAQVVLDWAATHPDTLIIVTADHETGGLQVVQNNGQGNLPTVTWSSGGHTATNVQIFATGPNADCVFGTLDNTQVFALGNNPMPAIAISPASIDKSVRWTHNPPPNVDSFTVRNSGLCRLDYGVSTDTFWLTAEPVSGTSSGEADTIWLSYDTTTLEPGSYAGHVTVTDPNAAVPTRQFTVNLTVKSVPGDFDSDKDVDQDDYAKLQICYAGSLAAIPPGCADADLNGNGHVDVGDLNTFLQCATGAEIAANPLCAD